MQSRPLTILTVAYPFAAVGPDAVGGAEQIVAALDQALVHAGHTSIVIAREDSRVSGQLVPVPFVTGQIDAAARDSAHHRLAEILSGLIDRRRIDLVHMHGIDFASYLPRPGPPLLATLHLPPDWYSPEALTPTRPNTWLNCVSRAQHEQCCTSPRLLQPIANGVPVQLLAAARQSKRSFALVLGRICPEKGQHLAIAAAKAADIPLVIAGEVFPYPAHQHYFRELIAPALDRRCRFIGALEFARKRQFLAAARCLLIPSLAAETSSLVAMEAAACGTPVVAFARGALSETVRHGVTGYLVNEWQEMAVEIGNVRSIDPLACRAEAQSRFSQRRMTDSYIALYRSLARLDAEQARA